MNINTLIKELIEYTIMELNPGHVDDDMPDLLDDWDKRIEAIDYLVEKLLKMKEAV